MSKTIQDADSRGHSVLAGTIGSHTKTSARAVDLLTALLADPSPQRRVNALSSLGFARQPRTLSAIHRLAHWSSQVRAWVAIALGRFPGPNTARRSPISFDSPPRPADIPLAAEAYEGQRGRPASRMGRGHRRTQQRLALIPARPRPSVRPDRQSDEPRPRCRRRCEHG